MLSGGRTEEGLRFLARARAAQPGLDLALELAFYGYAHDPDPVRRQASLTTLRQLLRTGARSPGWPLDGNVERARREGHAEPEFLARLACVIADACDVSDLDAFGCWGAD